MRRQRTMVALVAAACAAAVLLAVRGRPAPAGVLREPDRNEDECAVSECGADGVPLNAYAG